MIGSNEDCKDKEFELGEWVVEQRKTGLKGRTDSDFLLLFLRSCDFDLELTKKTMELYYRKRTMYPEWWADRDVRLPGVQKVLRANIVTVMQESSLEFPTVGIVTASPNLDPSLLNDIFKTLTIIAEVGMRMPTAQLNGGIAVIDASNCPSWVFRRFAWPPFAKKVVNTFLNSLPTKIKAFVYINCTPLALAMLTTFKMFLPQNLKEKLHCFGSDLSCIGSVVPLELLPTEYGGSAGPISRHQEMFFAKVTSFNEYLLEDNEYGATDV